MNKLEAKLFQKVIEPSPYVTEEMAAKARSFGIARVSRVIPVTNNLNSIILTMNTLKNNHLSMHLVQPRTELIDEQTLFQVLQIPINDRPELVDIRQTGFGRLKTHNHYYYAYRLQRGLPLLNQSQFNAQLLNTLPGVHLKRVNWHHFPSRKTRLRPSKRRFQTTTTN